MNKRPANANPKDYQYNSSLKRPKAGIKRGKPISRMTTDKDKARDERKLRKIRADYKKTFPHCVLCHRPVQDCHEIVWGKWRHITARLVQFWLPLCRWHHNEIHRSNDWPLGRQLAVKCKCDYKNFDLLFVNETLVGELDVPMSEVDSYLNELETK